MTEIPPLQAGRREQPPTPPKNHKINSCCTVCEPSRPPYCFPIARIHALPPPPPSFPHMCLCASHPLSTPSVAASVWPETTPEDRSKSRRRRRRRGGSALAPPVRPTTPSLVSRRVHGSVGRANQLLTTVLTYHHCTLASTLPTFTNKQQDRRKSVRSRNWA